MMFGRIFVYSKNNNGFRSFSTTGANTERQKVVVLGCGWSSTHFFKNLDKSIYDVTVVSPRNYFTFTPFLPAVCAGTLSTSACMEPIRSLTTKNGKPTINFVEAAAININTKDNTLQCRHTDTTRKDLLDEEKTQDFNIPFDHLVIGVGADCNTFNIPGVIENAYFLKEVEHARDIRKEVINKFEKANLPITPESEKQQLLTFVMVGGGPTGVETAAELKDFFDDEINKVYPHLMKYVRVILFEMSNKLLPMFTETVSINTLKQFKKQNIDVRFEHTVTKIDSDKIYCSRKKLEGNVQQVEKLEIPYGLVVWCAGVKPVKFSSTVQNLIEEQKKFRSLQTNEKLQLIGNNSIYALGDCMRVSPLLPSKRIDEYYDDFLKAISNKNCVSIVDYFLKNRDLYVIKYPQFANVNIQFFTQHFPTLAGKRFYDISNIKSNESNELISKQTFTSIINEIEKQYQSPAPTAQNAQHEGEYLAKIFNKYKTKEDKENAPAFIIQWKGSLAYVGQGNAAIDLPFSRSYFGKFPWMLFWRVSYLSMQLSFKNIYLCCSDWFKIFLFGRSVGRDSIKQTKINNPWKE